MQSLTNGMVSFFPQGIPLVYNSGQASIIVGTQSATVPTTIQVEEAHSTSQAEDQQQANLQLQSQEEPSEAQLEAGKQAIYSHPLLPLVTLLFEKCEQATQTSSCPSSESLDDDIQKFVRQQEQEGKPFFSEDPELDGLMIKALQVLRIHLLEIEKVSELCKDFCTRYITCLKTTLHSSQLLQFTLDGTEDSMMGNDAGSPNGQGQMMTTTLPTTAVMTQMGGNSVMIQGDLMQPAAAAVASLGQGQVVSGGTVYQMVQTPQGLVAQPIQMIANTQVTTAPVIHGSTPISQIGVHSNPLPELQPNMFTPTLVNCSQMNFDDDDDNQRKMKRGVLPKRATQIMKTWLFQHIAHPYPTEDEKRQIASQTNLTLLQVNNWFINGRRRILQPMLDNSSTTDTSKAKKNKGTSRSAQRFWPENIAKLNPNATAADDSNSQHSTANEEPNSGEIRNEESENLQSFVIINSVDGSISQQTGMPTILTPGVSITADGHVVQTAYNGALAFAGTPTSHLLTSQSGGLITAGSNFSIFQLVNTSAEENKMATSDNIPTIAIIPPGPQ